MIKTLFEQFIAEPGTRCSVLHGYLDKTVYNYVNNITGVEMNVMVDAPFKYTVPVMQELVHTGFIKIVSIGITEKEKEKD